MKLPPLSDIVVQHTAVFQWERSKSSKYTLTNEIIVLRSDRRTNEHILLIE